MAMTKHDVRDIGRIGFYTLIAWLTPPRFWRTAAQLTGWIGRTPYSPPAIKKIFANVYSDADIADAAAKLQCYARELNIQIFGLGGPWRSWRPDIRLNGITHLQKVLESGRGAILWVTETAFSTLIVKMALYNAGYHAIQLSRPGHGFSISNFGIRFLNPFWIRVEDRFIKERVLIIGETADQALAVLRTRLAANETVLITVAPLAHKFVKVPFFQAHLTIPTGPIQLARDTGAALLPVFTAAEDNGAFEVAIEEPLSGQAGDEDIAAAYVKRLEPFVRKHPDQWRGWIHNQWFTG
jgi:lauroyl/myristoyl acyltransferase